MIWGKALFDAQSSQQGEKTQIAQETQEDKLD